MKISHRLFLSNILMLAIPVAASAMVAYAILFVFSRNSEEPLERVFPQLVNITGNFNRTKDEGKLLEAVKAFNSEFEPEDLFIAITRDGEFIYPGNAKELLAGCEVLIPAMLTDGVVGNISLNDRRVVAEQIGKHRVLLADMRKNLIGTRFYGKAPAYYVFLIFGSLIVIITLTNRLLTHLLTRSIVIPLNSLADGVHELRDGNLEYRISYKRNDEFAPVCDDFNEMAGRLQSLIERQRRDEASRKELLAGISHDLRTPLTSIKAYVEGLLDGVAEDYPTQLKYLGVIRQKAVDIDQIVDKLFLFSKLEIGEFPFYHERLDIGEELADIAAAAAGEYGDKGLSVTIISNLREVFIYADPVQLRNALLNIMENSAKYKNKPRGILTVECRDLGGVVEIRLADDGPGVPEESLGKLFDVFYRGDESRNNPSKGSGLGLAITSRIMNRMGGGIRAENAEGGGLAIILTLPKYRGDDV